MGKCMIVGCGGVASVAIHKCCQNSDVFEEILIASRTKSKCDALRDQLSGGKTKIHTAQVNADHGWRRFQASTSVGKVLHWNPD